MSDGREHGEHKRDQVRCGSGTQDAFFFPNISCCSSGFGWRSSARRLSRSRPPKAHRAAALASDPVSTPSRTPPSYIHCPKTGSHIKYRDFANGTGFQDTPEVYRDPFAGRAGLVPQTSVYETGWRGRLVPSTSLRSWASVYTRTHPRSFSPFASPSAHPAIGH
jgi:hypothetical protein